MVLSLDSFCTFVVNFIPKWIGWRFGLFVHLITRRIWLVFIGGKKEETQIYLPLLTDIHTMSRFSFSCTHSFSSESDLRHNMSLAHRRVKAIAPLLDVPLINSHSSSGSAVEEGLPCRCLCGGRSFLKLSLPASSRIAILLWRETHEHAFLRLYVLVGLEVLDRLVKGCSEPGCKCSVRLRLAGSLFVSRCSGLLTSFFSCLATSAVFASVKKSGS